MVNTGETTSDTKLKSDLPEVFVKFNTFTNFDAISINQIAGTGGRFCTFEISVVGVKLPFAIATFSRLFDYLLNSVNSDVNPISGLNTVPIPNVVGAFGTTPEGDCLIQVDRTELIPTVVLTFTGKNLRLDYLDEYLNRTLAYLTEALQGDLNPDE